MTAAAHLVGNVRPPRTMMFTGNLGELVVLAGYVVSVAAAATVRTAL